MSPSAWDVRFTEMAVLVSGWSKDPNRRVGAVLVNRRRAISVGFNGLPRGVAHTRKRLSDDEVRGVMTVHAEVNAILSAVSWTTGATLYCTSFPCAACAGVIAQVGIVRVVCPRPEADSGWADSWDVATTILSEAGVDLEIT